MMFIGWADPLVIHFPDKISAQPYSDSAHLFIFSLLSRLPPRPALCYALISNELIRHSRRVECRKICKPNAPTSRIIIFFSVDFHGIPFKAFSVSWLKHTPNKNAAFDCDLKHRILDVK